MDSKSKEGIVEEFSDVLEVIEYNVRLGFKKLRFDMPKNKKHKKTDALRKDFFYILSLRINK